jgi:hypothetical protein
MNDPDNVEIEENLEHWKCVAARYMRQRDYAMKEVRALRAILLEKTGCVYDGQDYLREINETKTSATWHHKLRRFMNR